MFDIFMCSNFALNVQSQHSIILNNNIQLLCARNSAIPLEQVCVQLSTYADNVILPAFASRMPLLQSAGSQQSIDVSCLPGPQQKTYSGGFAIVRPC